MFFKKMKLRKTSVKVSYGVPTITLKKLILSNPMRITLLVIIFLVIPLFEILLFEAILFGLLCLKVIWLEVFLARDFLTWAEVINLSNLKSTILCYLTELSTELAIKPLASAESGLKNTVLEVISLTVIFLEVLLFKFFFSELLDFSRKSLSRENKVVSIRLKIRAYFWCRERERRKKPGTPKKVETENGRKPKGWRLMV